MAVLRAARLGALAVPLLLALATTPVLAADPSPSAPAEPAAPTCTERYPAEGPAGVDLRLGCIVSELVGAYTRGQPGPPPPLSSWVLGLFAVFAGLLLLFRVTRVALGRRMAPVAPVAWWACASCHSVNAGDSARCYACGGPRPQGPGLEVAAEPGTPQSFGAGRKQG